MIKQLVVVVLVVGISLASASGFARARDFEDYSDSLRNLPPRMRPFFDQEYRQQSFNAPLQESLNVRCVGRWPFGPSFNVRGQGNRLYLGCGAGIYILDITNPPNPVRLGQVCAKSLINQLVISDSLLYVGSHGLEIFNITNPANPVQCSWLNIPISDVFVKDSFAYCVSDDSLRIVNVRNPYNPFKVGACSTYSWSVVVSGNYAYVGGRYQLSIIDVSNPYNPQKVNSIGAYVYSIFVRGNHCYYVTSDNVLHILSIQDPLNPWEEGRLTGVYGMDLQVLDIFAYVPSFAIIDISDSSNPTRVGGCGLPAPGYGVWTNSPFGYTFIADQYEGLQVINISNPVNPWIEGRFDGADDSRDVFVLGNYAYVANQRKGLKILDVSNPANPFDVGEYDTTGQVPDLQTVWARDTLAFVPYNGGVVGYTFRILNIKDPSNPAVIGKCYMRTHGENIFVKDSFAYVVQSRSFQAFKIKNPSLPESLPNYLLPDLATPWAVFVKDTLAYIADGDSGLIILNVANPARPVEIGRFNVPPGGSGTGIFVEDTLAYFATWGGGLRILNVKDPTAPVELGFHPAAAWDVTVKDSIAYTTSSNDLKIINVSNPAVPIERGYYVTPYHPLHVFVSGNLIYTACYEAGIYILERIQTSVEEHFGTGTIEQRNKLIVFPNPSKGKIKVICYSADIKNVEMGLYDICGKLLVSKQKENVMGRFTNEFVLNDLPNGIYFVVLKAKERKSIEKIVLIH